MKQNMLTPVPEPEDFQNEDLEKVIRNLEKERTQTNLDDLIRLLKDKMTSQGLLLIPVQDVLPESGEDDNPFSMEKMQLETLSEPEPVPEASPRLVELAKGGYALAAFTSLEEFKKGEPSQYTAVLLREFLEYALEDDRYEGIVLNPWDVSVLIDRKMISSLIRLAEAQTINSSLYLIRDLPPELKPDGLGCFVTESLEPADPFSACLLQDHLSDLHRLSDKYGRLSAGSSILLTDKTSLTGKPFLVLMVAPIGEGSPAAEERAVGEIYQNGMVEAAKAGCTSLVLPVITGEDFGVQPSSSIPPTITTLSSWCAQNPEEEVEIFLLIPDSDLFSSYLDYLNGMEKQNGGSSGSEAA